MKIVANVQPDEPLRVVSFVKFDPWPFAEHMITLGEARWIDECGQTDDPIPGVVIAEVTWPYLVNLSDGTIAVGENGWDERTVTL